MKILVINGDCIQTNTSANLCHLAYINGLIDCGHEVTLLSADSRDYVTDKSMIIPDEVEQYTYYGVSLYEKMSMRKSRAVSAPVPDNNSSTQKKKSLKSKIIDSGKFIVLSMYGVHGIYAKFVKVAQRFSSQTEFDCVLSLSTPATSHLLTYKLLKKGRIKAKQWIQIWEDPWYSDIYGFNGKKRIYREEKRLLGFADKVCYVSPLTLANQKKAFPESAHKMYWQPLPYYYKNEETVGSTNNEKLFGYFGAYYPEARNLKPFYSAALEMGIKVNICGNPSNLFIPTDMIHIYPRLSLEELKPIEDETNVLIFLCNRMGGQIPGKIYQYSATNKTVLFILDGTDEEKKVLKEFFGKFNRYVFCDNTREDIIRAIKIIESGNLGEIKNRPLEDFNPKITIRNILDGEIL